VTGVLVGGAVFEVIVGMPEEDSSFSVAGALLMVGGKTLSGVSVGDSVSVGDAT
jgi:hypothetical protein